MNLFRTKPIDTDLTKDTGLKRVLGPVDLTLMGIGAIIGTGIFVLTGIGAANYAGPALVLSFMLAGAVCTCAAMSYAELASSIGGSGSAYAYGYAGLGEFPAWVIGWMLILEYTIAISAVSVGWSGYVHNALQAMDIVVPQMLLHSPFDAQTPGIINLPASLIILALGALLLSGAKMSALINAIVVVIKVSVVLLFIAVAAFNVDPSNWMPFVPERALNPVGEMAYGWEGIVTGASIVFFAYIGFDAVSTAAEECGDPQRDMPIGIISSLVICTVLYMIVSFLLTGVMPYGLLNTPSPISDSLLYIGLDWAAGVIAIGAIAGLTTVMLVLYYALTRILFAVSRDGLIPNFFAPISPHTKSPARAIVMMGIIMSLIAGLIPLGDLAELTNMGTLGAFTVVCAGVLILRRSQPDLARPFKVPGGPVFPVLGIIGCLYLMSNLQHSTWIAFLIWNGIGLLIYFGYSFRNSVLGSDASSTPRTK
ncbi:MAG TPA: amino acid permease [Gammaproteobacteria bacterium]|nr:amino acid permease [Gammaproteobacteria bacterium]